MALPAFIRPMSFSLTLISSAKARPPRPTLPNAKHKNTTKFPSLSTTSTHKRINMRPAAVVSAPVGTPEAVEEEKEKSSGWKYPFSEVVIKKRRNLFLRKWTGRDVLNASVALSMHLLCLFAPFNFNWGAVKLSAVLLVFSTLGLTLSFHRNLSHRSFKLPQWLEYFWAYCGVHALQGTPMAWVCAHRIHHRYADTLQDPHSPIEGFWFSHMNWIFDTETLYKKQGGPLSNIGDLDKQFFYRFIESSYLAHHIGLATLLYTFGGFPYLVWGMGVRTVLVNQVAFLHGSVLHIWGSTAYNTPDNSRNSWLISLASLGDGWHNNHHAFEYSARQGLEWWQIDFTWYMIKLMEIMGLATDVKVPSEAQKQKALQQWSVT